jgi:hypothetical protein
MAVALGRLLAASRPGAGRIRRGQHADAPSMLEAARVSAVLVIMYGERGDLLR